MVGGKGTFSETLSAKFCETVNVEGVPRLYTVYSNISGSVGLLGLRFTKGVHAHESTLG